MPVSGNYGTPGNPYGDIYSSYWDLEWYSGSDPPHVQGDEWGRSDLAPGDSIATIRVDHHQGSGVWDIPVFPTSIDPNSNPIKKFDRIETPSGRGWIPWVESAGEFKQIGTYHNGTRHGLHNSLTAIPESGVSRWEFEQDVTDSWGNNDGTNNGATFTTDAETGTYALNFDGSNDYVHISDSFVITSGPVSFSAWIKRNATTENVIYGQANTAGVSIPLLFQVNSNDNAEIRYTDDSSTDREVEGTVTIGQQWTHVVGTIEGAINEIYVNGSLDNSADTGGSGVVRTFSSPTSDIGALRRSSSPFYADGIIDDVRIYDKALSDTEVNDLYNTGSII